jgi:hypothetical protein
MLEKISGLLSVVIPLAGFGITPVAAHAGVEEGLPSITTMGFKEFFGSRDFVQRERDDVGGDHLAVALHVSQCYGEINNPMAWTPAIWTLLLIKPAQDMILARPTVQIAEQSEKLPPIHPFHQAAIAFSDRISRDHMEFRQEFVDAREASNRCQFFAIGLGALATVLVSLRALMTSTSRWPNIMSGSAIVVSALVTVVTSINSFENYTSVALRDQRAISQLQQLHWRVASDVMQRPELCGKSPPTDSDTQKAMEVVIAWRSRLENILDAATESISKPGDLSGGGGSTGTGADANRSAPTNQTPELRNPGSGRPREAKAG